MLKHSSRRFYGFGYNKLQISCTTKVLTLLGAYYLMKNYHFNMKLRASVQVIYNILTHASILHDFSETVGSNFKSTDKPSQALKLKTKHCWNYYRN